MVQREQQKPGEQKPSGGGENPQDAQNKTAKRAPKEDGTENVERSGETAAWGSLPEYLGGIKQRGGVPEVSEKYRKLYEAYLKAQAKKPGDKK